MPRHNFAPVRKCAGQLEALPEPAPESYETIAQELVRAGLASMAILEYPLPPERPFRD